MNRAKKALFALSLISFMAVKKRGGPLTREAIAEEMNKLALIEPQSVALSAAEAILYAHGLPTGNPERDAAVDKDVTAAGLPTPRALRRSLDAARDASEAAHIERRLNASGIDEAADAIARAIQNGSKPKGGAQ